MSFGQNCPPPIQLMQSIVKPPSTLGAEPKQLRNLLFFTVSPGQAIKLLPSQVPKYAGAERNDMDQWIQKIEQVARIHRASENVQLMAATGKLIRMARWWFDSHTSTVNQS